MYAADEASPGRLLRSMNAASRRLADERQRFFDVAPSLHLHNQQQHQQQQQQHKSVTFVEGHNDDDDAPPLLPLPHAPPSSFQPYYAGGGGQQQPRYFDPGAAGSSPRPNSASSYHHQQQQQHPSYQQGGGCDNCVILKAAVQQLQEGLRGMEQQYERRLEELHDTVSFVEAERQDANRRFEECLTELQVARANSIEKDGVILEERGRCGRLEMLLDSEARRVAQASVATTSASAFSTQRELLHASVLEQSQRSALWNAFLLKLETLHVSHLWSLDVMAANVALDDERAKAKAAAAAAASSVVVADTNNITEGMMNTTPSRPALNPEALLNASGIAVAAQEEGSKPSPRVEVADSPAGPDADDVIGEASRTVARSLAVDVALSPVPALAALASASHAFDDTAAVRTLQAEVDSLAATRDALIDQLATARHESSKLARQLVSSNGELAGLKSAHASPVANPTGAASSSSASQQQQQQEPAGKPEEPSAQSESAVFEVILAEIRARGRHSNFQGREHYQLMLTLIKGIAKTAASEKAALQATVKRLENSGGGSGGSATAASAAAPADAVPKATHEKAVAELHVRIATLEEDAATVATERDRLAQQVEVVTAESDALKAFSSNGGGGDSSVCGNDQRPPTVDVALQTIGNEDAERELALLRDMLMQARQESDAVKQELSLSNSQVTALERLLDSEGIVDGGGQSSSGPGAIQLQQPALEINGPSHGGSDGIASSEDGLPPPALSKKHTAVGHLLRGDDGAAAAARSRRPSVEGGDDSFLLPAPPPPLDDPQNAGADDDGWSSIDATPMNLREATPMNMSGPPLGAGLLPAPVTESSSRRNSDGTTHSGTGGPGPLKQQKHASFHVTPTSAKAAAAVGGGGGSSHTSPPGPPPVTSAEMREQLAAAFEGVRDALAMSGADISDTVKASIAAQAERHAQLLEAHQLADAARKQQLDKVQEDMAGMKLVMRNLLSNASHHQRTVSKELAAVQSLTSKVSEEVELVRSIARSPPPSAPALPSPTSAAGATGPQVGELSIQSGTPSPPPPQDEEGASAATAIAATVQPPVALKRATSPEPAPPSPMPQFKHPSAQPVPVVASTTAAPAPAVQQAPPPPPPPPPPPADPTPPPPPPPAAPAAPLHDWDDSDDDESEAAAAPASAPSGPSRSPSATSGGVVSPTAAPAKQPLADPSVKRPGQLISDAAAASLRPKPKNTRMKLQ